MALEWTFYSTMHSTTAYTLPFSFHSYIWSTITSLNPSKKLVDQRQSQVEVRGQNDQG